MKLPAFIQIDTRKGLVGIILGLAAACFSCVFSAWIFSPVFFVAFTLAGFLKLDFHRPLWNRILVALWIIGFTFSVYYLPIPMAGMFRPIAPYFYTRLPLNLAVLFVVFGLVLLLTGRWKTAITVTSVLFLLLLTANAVVFSFRGKELYFSDFLSLKTALGVASEYTLSLRKSVVASIGIWVLLTFSQYALPDCGRIPAKKQRFGAILLTAVSFAVLWFGSADVPIKLWGTQGTMYNGYYLNFFLSIQDSRVERPENYSTDSLQQLEAEYQTADVQPASLPNILVIMDESYADFDIFGEEVSSNIPITPYLDSLEDNVIRGYALTSVYGGNTANAEFEFLSGHSMAFLPSNSVVYQQYASSPFCTLPWYVQSLGYKAMATHPFSPQSWSRDTVYPLLGFEESTFIQAYRDAEADTLRHYVSDQGMFDYLLNTLDENKDPLFLFGITMQNHGGYNYKGEDFPQTISLEGYSADYPLAEQYFSLIHITDAAMENLLTELEAYPENTIVLFFGDHFPKVEQELYTELHGGSFDTLSEQMLQYTVPFLIWANFDIPEQTVDLTSLNYLPRYLLDAAGLQLPAYYQFLSDTEAVIPAINAYGYYSLSQNTFLTLDEATGEEAQWLNRYAMLQYNNLFDAKHRSSTFYQQYLDR